MLRAYHNYPGMAGFCVSGIFCAALTSISSAVNSLAAVTIEDFVKPICGSRGWAKDEIAARLSKCFGIYCIT